MFHSSTSSSDTFGRGSWGRILAPGLLWCGLLLLLLEVGLRVLVPNGHVPTGAWYNAELRDQAGQLEALGGVDVMITGSSVSTVNVPPLGFDEELVRRGVNLTSFNAGVRGCDYSGIYPVFRTVFWSRRQAPVVILVVAPVDLDENNAFVKQRSARFRESLQIGRLVGFSRDLFRHLWLFGFRNEIRHYSRSGEWLYEPSRVTQRGHTDLGSEQLGRGEYAFRFQQSGEIATTLFNMVDWLTRQGVRVLVVPGLMDSATWAMVAPEEMARFEAILAELDAREGVQYVEARDLTRPDSEFIDELHLTTGAAWAYAQSLAQRLAPYLGNVE
ncbi:MAG TPA: hypothetical protein VM198_00165 [Longimicrobiales bacterium]|nr:hypothetical protein [Longimicrobiales bacterium]